MAQILRDPAALRQLDETELAGAIYEDYSQATPFERGVGILADALEHWGAHGDGQHLRAGAASRRTTRDLEGRPYDITLHADGRAPDRPSAAVHVRVRSFIVIPCAPSSDRMSSAVR